MKFIFKRFNCDWNYHHVFYFFTDSERKVNIKTEPTDEEVPEGKYYDDKVKQKIVI